MNCAVAENALSTRVQSLFCIHSKKQEPTDVCRLNHYNMFTHLQNEETNFDFDQVLMSFLSPKKQYIFTLAIFNLSNNGNSGNSYNILKGTVTLKAKRNLI